MEKPLSVAVAAVVRDGKILMIKRERGDYTGYWALPGGKVEKGEHIAEAAERELLEESGLKTFFESYQGIISELFGDKHFMLHVVELEPLEGEVSGGEEGEVRWIDLEDVEDFEIIPSDRKIVGEVVKGSGGYFECLMTESEGEHFVERFESRGEGF